MYTIILYTVFIYKRIGMLNRQMYTQAWKANATIKIVFVKIKLIRAQPEGVENAICNTDDDKETVFIRNTIL